MTGTLYIVVVAFAFIALLMMGTLCYLAFRVVVGAQKAIVQEMRQVKESVVHIAESKRLTTILEIEAKKGLDVEMGDFEAKRDALKAALLVQLEEQLGKDKAFRNQPDTMAWCVLDHSGFKLFVESDVSQKAQKALGRLLANGDVAKARKFVVGLANAL
ncbi:MAG: hypothetical protein A3A43_01025 [Candidatus Liptonbacteria bacterium RIFCSPLOWO2_01_FULL_56_20]|uniref:Uncharacterized protein n=1 Tax=Candidatus Liptonbacteria bacterium RIFCSPLOWO2_01_FULL_56_20 TaxID=1798652 RepID=A0A1G2CLW7_9BACT|nr:MAG: hypothetical protein UY96_C0016G0010 [Parcubacteria group bacterium GW2011_GWB1_56_8]OGZ01740.1 MAG: hypothetical protein A3A43_01025 [Candidatus Liptonbacteria bacterium RIFCSPLOWO2_01_FULL_56_20]